MRLSNILAVVTLVFLNSFFSDTAFSLQFKKYLVDESPLKSSALNYQRYFSEKASEEVKKNRMMHKPTILEKIEYLKQNIEIKPEWIDGYWLLAQTYVGYAGSLVDPNKEKEARRYFSLAIKVTNLCLRRSPKNPLCHFFAGVAKGQLATLDGVLASLGKGKEIEDHFLAVYNSNYDHKVGKESLQSLTRQSLGIYYRVVPDSAILHWLFSIRGDKKKSVKMHREAQKLDPPNPCSYVFTAVAEICYGNDEEIDSMVKAGISNLKKSIYAPISNPMMINCVKDAKRLLKTPENACGYTPLRHQDISEEDIESLSH